MNNVVIIAFSNWVKWEIFGRFAASPVNTDSTALQITRSEDSTQVTRTKYVTGILGIEQAYSSTMSARMSMKRIHIRIE